MKDTLKQVMEGTFRPEFLNRVDDIIVFRSLTKVDMKTIVDHRTGARSSSGSRRRTWIWS